MAKIAISLPDKMLQLIEAERQASGETRSEFFRLAVDAFLRHRREREKEEQYIRGYQQQPETEEEIALAESIALLALADSPWEADDKRLRGDTRPGRVVFRAGCHRLDKE